MDGIEKAELALRQQIATTREGWAFAEEDYLSNGSFVADLKGMTGFTAILSLSGSFPASVLFA